MRARITISVKIWITCTILVCVIIGSTLISAYFFRNIRHLNRYISEVHMPSVNYLSDLEFILHSYDDARMMMSAGDTINLSAVADKLAHLKQIGLPAVTKNLNRISNRWPVRDQQLYLQLSKLVSDSLVNLYESLLGTYADPYVTGASERMAITEHIDQTSSVITENLHLLKKKYNGLITTAMTQIEKYHDASMIYLVIMGMLLALSAFLLVLIIIRSVLRPLKQFGSILQDMGKGTLPPELLPGRQDEIGQMAQAMNNLAGRLKVLSGFAEEIGRGNYASDFQPLSENDILGNALIRMREDLKNAAVEESRRKTEDERRNWSNQGIARFSEILREHNNDIDKLNESVISNLVRYTNARVGALFLVNRPSSGNNFLELSAAYAYDRMKYLKKEIPAGEGLAGRCLQEGETIYLTDVPDDYIKIRSGMGEANPTSVLIVPLKMHEEIVGIVELASFESFEPYKIEFMERIGTSIASTIAAIRSGLKRSVSASKAGDRVSEPTDDGEQVITAGKPDETKDTSAPDRTEEIRKKLDDLLKKKQ